MRPGLAGRVARPVRDAIDYALSGSGKRARGVLVLLSHEAAGGTRDVRWLAAAIEVVHAYSLVHDDLPCMDDDDLRRGRPTVHRRFDVDTATLAGVAMVPLAVIAAIDGGGRAGLPEPVIATIVNELMRCAGGGGMIGGQILDLEAEGRSLGVGELERIHGAKTGALFSTACRTGALAAATSVRRVDALGRFGAALGLAFQVTDDVLDVVASSADLGKPAGRDEALRKSTYPAAVGVEAAEARARALVDGARRALTDEALPTERLARLAEIVVKRAA